MPAELFNTLIKNLENSGKQYDIEKIRAAYEIAAIGS